MSSKKKFDLSASDESRMKQILNTFQNLDSEAKDVCLLELSAEHTESYPRKRVWSTADNMALRLGWNKMNHDELCDGLECAYSSLMAQAIVLGLHPQHGRILNGDDVWKMKRMMELGESPKSVAELYGIEYDFKESAMITKETEERLEMKQDELFGGGE